MFNKLIATAFLFFIVLNLKAQYKNTEVLKKWVLKAEVGATTRGFSSTSFYKDSRDNFYGDLFGSAPLLQGVGFHSNLSYGHNFGGRYYLGTSLGYNSQRTNSNFNIETIPLSMHLKINYFEDTANTFYVQGNLGYALPLSTFYRGVNFGYNIGYQFVASKISNHLLAISLQNQVQNIRGVYYQDYMDLDPVTNTIVNYGPMPYFGRYKLSGWGLNLAYTF